MPTNFDALLRYHTIDQCLQNRFRSWTVEELAEKCTEAIMEANYRPNKNTISKRTIQEDIKIMRSNLLGYNAPIIAKNGAYYYEDKNFSIRNVTLTTEDIQNLGAAIKMFKAYKGLEFFREVESLVSKLEKKVQVKTYREVQGIISFENLPATGGEKWINPLAKAIMQKFAIQLTHKKFDRQEEKQYVIHPYFLKEYRNRWYIIGWYDKDKYLKTFALDRILDFLPLPKVEYLEQYKPDPETYFENTIGISLSNTEPEEIELRFNGSMPAYIKSQPLHASQKILEETGKTLTIGVKLTINYELESLILSFADEVEVLKPASLAIKIKKRWMKALRMDIEKVL